MLFTSTFIVALLPLTFASPVPSRTYLREASISDLVAPVVPFLPDVTSGVVKEKREAAPVPQSTTASTGSTASSDDLLGSLLDPVTGLLGGILKREAAPQSDSTTTSAGASTTASSGLLGSLLSPVTGILGGLLRREAAPQSASTSTGSSLGLDSLLDPVTSLLGGILRRTPSVE